MIPHTSAATLKDVGIPLRAFTARAVSGKASISFIYFLTPHVNFFKVRSLCVADSGRIHSCLPLKGNLSSRCSASSLFMFLGDYYGIEKAGVAPSLPGNILHDVNTFSSSKRSSSSRASVYKSRHRSTDTTEKPKWWWRSLACVPYLMPLHVPWMYAETGYRNHPFIRFLEPWAEPFCMYFIGFLPTWSTMLYYYAAYLGVVRRKEWPRFFRHHVITAMLLDNILQVATTISRWTPIGYRMGSPMMHVWAALIFALLFMVLECIRSALIGKVPDIPFVGDAASLHMDSRFR